MSFSSQLDRAAVIIGASLVLATPVVLLAIATYAAHALFVRRDPA